MQYYTALSLAPTCGTRTHVGVSVPASAALLPVHVPAGVLGRQQVMAWDSDSCYLPMGGHQDGISSSWH